MNIRDLKYLVALADYGHFGKAAASCFVSQPALSMQIKKLETSLGVALLERTNKSVRLTDAGIIIAERARLILNQVVEVQEIAKSASDPFTGELKIGIFPTLAPYLLPLIIPSLSRLFPKLTFYLIEEQTDILIDKLKHGKLDAAFLSLPIMETGFKHTLLFEEEFLLAAPSNHPLSKHKSIHSRDLDNKSLLLLDEGHCLREQALSYCHKMHASETQNFRATSLETLRQMVAARVGITLIPKLACTPNKDICYIPFNVPRPVRRVAIFWRASSSRVVVLNEVIAHIKKLLIKHKEIKTL